MAGESPNVLLITTDTQRWDTLRCAGSLHARSPHLDRLAAEGTGSPMPTRRAPCACPRGAA